MPLTGRTDQSLPDRLASQSGGDAQATCRQIRTLSICVNLRTARIADLELTMRVTQWLGKPAAGFIHAAHW